MKLGNPQLEKVRKRIRSLGYNLPLLVDELMDHVSSDIEERMDKGQKFENALSETLEDLKVENSNDLQSQVIRILMKDLAIRRNVGKYSIIAAGSLALWVLIEFLAQSLFGIGELGRWYGLLSQVIVAAVLWLNYRQVKSITGGVIRPWPVFSNGILLSFLASSLFLVFLVFFWTWVDSQFYSHFQMIPEPDFNTTRLLYATGAGMFAGTFFTGLVVSGILSSISRFTSPAWVSA